jgi:hypothetical protein
MEIEFAFLCDYAQQESKLNAIGIGWDTIMAPELPVRHTIMTFVARLRGSITEAGVKDVTIRIIDADGQDVIPAVMQQMQFNVQAPALFGFLNVVIQLGGLEFQKYGAYAIHLLLSGNELARVAFQVVQPPSPPQGPTLVQ